MLRKCKYCNINFESRLKSSYCCNSIKCDRSKRRDLYKNRMYKKICIVCNNDYEGTKKSLICSESCKLKYQEKNLKYIVDIYCKKCTKYIKNVEKLTNIYGINTVSKIEYKTCLKCKEDVYIKWSKSQKGSNNTNWKDIKKVRTRKFTDEELKHNMSVNNPMKRKDVRDKVAKKIKEKYKNGELIKPIGKLSKLYKGNRKRSFTIRDRLINWRKLNLERSSYRCEICNINSNKLEVHHEEPFRDILSKFLKNRILDDLTYEDFEILCDEIVKYHENIIGKVVCKKCHSEIDKYRKL